MPKRGRQKSGASSATFEGLPIVSPQNHDPQGALPGESGLACLAFYAFAAAATSFARFVASHVKSASVRPKCPWIAVLR